MEIKTSDSLVHNQYELVRNRWNFHNLPSASDRGRKLLLRCEELVMNEGSVINLNQYGYRAPDDENENDIFGDSYRLQMKRGYVAQKTIHDVDSIVDLKNIKLKRGHGVVQRTMTWTSHAGFKGLGGGVIDIDCKKMVMMGHGASIVANGREDEDYGGSIRVLCSSMKMDKTAKIEAKRDGNIFIGIEEHESTIEFENISPKPVVGKRVNPNKLEWKIMPIDQEDNGGKGNDEDAYWDNFFKNNNNKIMI